MGVIGLNDIPVWSSTSTSGNLEARKFRYLYDSSMHNYYYILQCLDLMTQVVYNIIIPEGNVFDYLEVKRINPNPKRFSIKKVLIPETGGYTISISNDYVFSFFNYIFFAANVPVSFI